MAGSNGTIVVYEVVNNDTKELKEITRKTEAHLGPIWRIEFCHPIFREFIATCSLDKTVKIWQLVNDNLTEVYSLEIHTSSVNGISWAPYQYGFKVACCSSDGMISIIDERNWTNNFSWKAHDTAVNSVSWAPVK